MITGLLRGRREHLPEGDRPCEVAPPRAYAHASTSFSVHAAGGPFVVEYCIFSVERAMLISPNADSYRCSLDEAGTPASTAFLA